MNDSLKINDDIISTSILLLMDCVFNIARQLDGATQHVIKAYLAHIFFNILINKLPHSIVNQYNER